MGITINEIKGVLQLQFQASTYDSSLWFSVTTPSRRSCASEICSPKVALWPSSHRSVLNPPVRQGKLYGWNPSKPPCSLLLSWRIGWCDLLDLSNSSEPLDKTHTATLSSFGTRYSSNLGRFQNTDHAVPLNILASIIRSLGFASHVTSDSASERSAWRESVEKTSSSQIRRPPSFLEGQIYGVARAVWMEDDTIGSRFTFVSIILSSERLFG